MAEASETKKHSARLFHCRDAGELEGRKGSPNTATTLKHHTQVQISDGNPTTSRLGLGSRALHKVSEIFLVKDAVKD